MKNNINSIYVSKENNKKIIFTWTERDEKQKIELFIEDEKDFEKNSFDKIFDFIISSIENNEEIKFELEENIRNDSDSRISHIIKGIVEICEKEIKEIKDEINGGI